MGRTCRRATLGEIGARVGTSMTSSRDRNSDKVDFVLRNAADCVALDAFLDRDPWFGRAYCSRQS